MYKRRKMSKRHSRKVFKKGNRIKKRNYRTVSMRGGIRL